MLYKIGLITPTVITTTFWKNILGCRTWWKYMLHHYEWAFTETYGSPMRHSCSRSCLHVHVLVYAFKLLFTRTVNSHVLTRNARSRLHSYKMEIKLLRNRIIATLSMNGCSTRQIVQSPARTRNRWTWTCNHEHERECRLGLP